MDAFVKNFATYRTIKKAAVLASALTVDSLEKDNSTVTVKGTDIGRSDTGNWLICDGQVFRIAQVKPQKDRTLLTLSSPLDAFSRPLELEIQVSGQTVGGFISGQLTASWAAEPDPVYAVPYLQIENADETGFVPPEVNSGNTFSLPDYCRKMRKAYRVTVRFFDAGSKLRCRIFTQPPASRQVSFADGRSQLQSVDYSASGTAKVTVLCDVDTGLKDDAGEKIYTRERSDWYLSESGEISQAVPARRASGTWETVYVKGRENVEPKVVEVFSKNAASHKLEFWSELDLSVQDDCTFFVYGELLRSHISYKRKSSEDRRFYYKSGLLATTASEKLKEMKA